MINRKIVCDSLVLVHENEKMQNTKQQMTTNQALPVNIS